MIPQQLEGIKQIQVKDKVERNYDIERKPW